MHRLDASGYSGAVVGTQPPSQRSSSSYGNRGAVPSPNALRYPPRASAIPQPMSNPVQRQRQRQQQQQQQQQQLLPSSRHAPPRTTTSPLAPVVGSISPLAPAPAYNTAYSPTSTPYPAAAAPSQEPLLQALSYAPLSGNYYPLRREVADFEACLTFTMWKYSDSTSSTFEQLRSEMSTGHTTLNNEAGNKKTIFGDWINAAPPQTSSGLAPEAGMRVAVFAGLVMPGPQQFSPTPDSLARCQNFDATMSAFRIPKAVVRDIDNYLITFRVFPGVQRAAVTGTNGPNVPDCWYHCSNTWAAAWNFDPETRITNCIIFSRDRAYVTTFESRIIDKLFLHKDYVYYRSTPGIVVSSLALEMCDSTLSNGRSISTTVALQSGTDVQAIPGAAERAGQPQPPAVAQEVDYSSLLSRLSTATLWVNTELHRLHALKPLLERLLPLDEDCLQSQSPGANVHKENLALLRSTIKYLAGVCSDFEMSNRSVRDNASIQLQIIYNRIAQQDMRSSLAVAEASRRLAYESRKDSSSMKTLAFVTMFFLPATLVSGLFDAGVVDTTNSTSVFWAVAVPLTALTYGVWLIWWIGMRRREKRTLMKLGMAMPDENIPGNSNEKAHGTGIDAAQRI